MDLWPQNHSRVWRLRKNRLDLGIRIERTQICQWGYNLDRHCFGWSDDSSVDPEPDPFTAQSRYRSHASHLATFDVDCPLPVTIVLW